MQLCTFSKSHVHASAILPECPLALTGAIAKKCPCRKRIYVDDLRLLSCTHPTTWRGDMIRDSDALAASLRGKHETAKATAKTVKKREKELETWEMSTVTTTEAPAKAPANGTTNGLTTNGAHKPEANTTPSNLILGGPSRAALAFYRRMTDPLDAVAKLGNMFFESRMFGCNNPAQGRVLAMICLSEGKTPSQLLKQNHIIGGKLSDKADAMLAAFRLRGGRHIVKKYTPDVVQIEFVTPEQKFVGSFTWVEAQEEDYVYTSDANNGKVPKKLKDGTVNRAALKDNWSTPRRRAQMLWARVVSDSVRHLMPEANCGEYTADELGGNETFDGEDVYVDAEFEVVPVGGETADVAGASDVVDADVVETQPADQAAAQEAVSFSTEAATKPAADGTTTHLQVDANPHADADCIIDMPRLTRLAELKQAIGYSREEWDAKVLSKFGVPSAKQLTRGMADLLIPKLEEKLRTMQQRDELSRWADPRPEVPSRDVVKN